MKYEGYIHISKIKNQIIDFDHYNISEIFREITLLKEGSIALFEEKEKLKVEISFIILGKEKKLKIDLEVAQEINMVKNNIINEQKEAIQKQDEKINMLEKKLKKYYKEENDNYEMNDLYNNFNFKLKEHPIKELNYHNTKVLCLIKLKDGRMASSAYSIVIYNNKTHEPDLIIREHSGAIYCLTQLSSGILASCSEDKTIKLFNISGNNYSVVQTLDYHKDKVYKIIELQNKQLASCSHDKSIIIYFKENDVYKLDYRIQTNGPCSSVIQTKKNEICYSESDNHGIVFFDLLERKKKGTINNINKVEHLSYEKMLMITKDLLFIGGNNKISLINVYQYNLSRVINVTDSGYCSFILRFSFSFSLEIRSFSAMIISLIIDH